MINFFKKNTKEPKNLKEVIKYLKDIEKKVDNNIQKIENIEKDNKYSFQKIGVVRYNPFSGVGSDQSFSIALLNGDNNGFLITSIYSRDGSRVYGKPVKNGKSVYSLSKEEVKAIEKAIISK